MPMEYVAGLPIGSDQITTREGLITAMRRPGR
jgi:hypothetical protein